MLERGVVFDFEHLLSDFHIWGFRDSILECYHNTLVGTAVGIPLADNSRIWKVQMFLVKCQVNRQSI